MTNPFRLGHGYDVHRFDLDAPSGTQQLGGIAVAVQHPLLAHSDGDVVLHAIIDAILGAMAWGDIGEWFPDTDAQWRNADSRELVRHLWLKVTQAGYVLGNVDVTVVAEQPKMNPHKAAMRQHIATLLQAAPEQVNVKATTTETLGFTGRGEGMACYAVVLLTAHERAL
jgi:2-C-methyl-D-erythritol 2,4-cyclodiphosphate synthase